MGSSYIESYKDLYHGTTELAASQIVASQTFIPSKGGWCGQGIYFYDVKAKAWWSANRTCRNERDNGNTKARPDIVIADIIPLSKSTILDLRSPDDLKAFADFVDEFLSEEDFDITEDMNEDEQIKLKRALLLSFYCEENNLKLVIGYFKQQPQEKIDATKQFADSWQLAIGIETIYCAKDSSIVHNIRRKGGNYS